MSDAAGALLAGVDWAAVAILTPLVGGAAAFVLPNRARAIGVAASGATAAAAVALVWLIATGGPYDLAVGGWSAPLGIRLAADGLSAALLGMTNLVGASVAVHVALTGRATKNDPEAGVAAWGFWPLWLLLLAGLNALYLSADIFNLYVTLEMVGLSAVGLAALSGKADAFKAAMRYLLVGIIASLVYLLGVTLLYAQYGVLDLATLRQVMIPAPATQLAMVAMLAALAMKSALFPLHGWLPPAHGNATAPVSALLSALVVKASLYIAVRLWLDLFEPTGVGAGAVATVLGILGACAVLWGGLQALIAKRLKLVVAYSTVAQVGYLFMCFPLWAGGREALTAFVYLAVAHAFAKSALFLACEQVQRALGDDQMSSLSRPELPGAVKITFALAAVSLVGLPPSGGFIGKWLLLDSTLLHGPTVWTVAVLCGTLLSAAAMARVLARFFAPEEQAVAQDLVVGDAASWRFSLTPLLLAAAAVGIGLLGAWPAELVNVGETVQ
ncbi:complex I subunit 5 family protein [Phenylobacterium sp. J367]|uniref:complex I subunit 5 family protein n=1 Tax=Phenylobacterium sp. J367 TaxID=2898435 RepID=UPI002150AC3D|nr:proton-conducting transporter membrane subunit [Phenylobacterium sp. J367]MCR5881283.1 hypothetical protein [Phenylobacterium sp. J367]